MFTQRRILGPYRLHQLEHEAYFAVDGCIRGEKFLNLERWGQIKELAEHIKDVLHECIVILGDQVAKITLLDVICHILRVDEEDVVDCGQVHTCVAGQNSVVQTLPMSQRELGTYLSVDTCALYFI